MYYKLFLLFRNCETAKVILNCRFYIDDEKHFFVRKMLVIAAVLNNPEFAFDLGFSMKFPILWKKSNNTHPKRSIWNITTNALHR